MDKANLHEGRDYAYRQNTRAWERVEDRPIKVKLLKVLPKGQNQIQFPDGSVARVRSAQLVLGWEDDAVAELLREEERERGFRENTFSNRAVAGAADVVLEGLLGPDSPYVDHDRVHLTSQQERTIAAAAEVTHDLADLSPGVHRRDGDTWLPLPVVELLAKRIAERAPEAVAAEIDRQIGELQERGHASSLLEYYKPKWDLALEWAGKDPVALPPQQMSPREAFQQLFELLRGQGTRCDDSEGHAWVVEEAQLRDLGTLLGPVASYLGRLSLRALGDGMFRLALDMPRAPEVFNTRDMTNFALSLTQPQVRMLVEIRDAGEQGLEFPRGFGRDRTLESLIGRDLVWESEGRETSLETRLDRGRFRLTDGGWRALELMQADPG
ncbi:MAG TPA: hypothetical protein VF731_05175 [Solirubrobacterales bacterium]